MEWIIAFKGNNKPKEGKINTFFKVGSGSHHL
jgi:hypothetical protein